MTQRKFIAPLALALAVGISGLNSAHAQDAGRFPTPEAAVDAILDALHARSAEDLIAVFGAEAEGVILTGEAPRDRAAWGEFLDMYDDGNFINIIYGDTAVLFIGEDNWSFPAPMRLGDDGLWAFDVEEAREEILTRRIGRNELEVIEIMHGYVQAQTEYRSQDFDGDGVKEFASNILSSPGQKDGLYWPGKDSPVGDFVAQAAADGYSIDGTDHDPVPYAGYYYRLLNSQGEDAPGGAMDYIINGHQVAGHGLVAAPASYGDTGIMTFMVSENGIVMEADLGEDTLEKLVGITSYNLGEDWAPAE